MSWTRRAPAAVATTRAPGDLRDRSERATELRHLRSFVAVAEELKFSRAADRPVIAGPPRSQQIQKLEALLGVGLFARTNRRVELSKADPRLLHKTRETLAAAEDAADTGRRAQRGGRGGPPGFPG